MSTSKKIYTNDHNISLLMAVFLADDHYDHVADPTHISVTTLMKPLRQIILNSRLKQGDNYQDVAGLLPSRMGTALHEGIENSWVNNLPRALGALGYPAKAAARILINPEGEIPAGAMPMWFELRTSKQVGKWSVSGCADVIMDGMVRDIKSTKVWSYMSGANDPKYILQLSLYRWLNPDKVTKDIGAIEYLFTDFNALEATYKEGYPTHAVMAVELPLQSHAEMQRYTENKLADIELHEKTHEQDLPLCTPQDLWMGDSEWKYYSKPGAARATKNFKGDMSGAFAHRTSKGTGEVREIKSKAKACNYCNARTICSQYQTLVTEGLI